MGRVTKFQSSWKIQFPWVVKAIGKGEDVARCEICKSNFSISNQGKASLKKHSMTKKHIDLVETLSMKSPQRLLLTESL